MASWLNRATSLFQQPPPPMEPFQVECDCGTKISGQRAANYQKPTCPACGRQVFVLPANVYPQQKPAARKKPNSDIVESPVATPVPKTMVKGVPAAPSPLVPLPKSPAIIDERITRSAMESELTVRRFLYRPKITRLRMVAIAIFFMSLLTVIGLIRRQQFETAKSIVSKAADAGAAAIRDHDFVKAELEFGRARAAVDLLGRTDSAAEEIRQQSREMTAIAKLSSSTLTELLEETLAKKASPGQPLPLSTALKGAWVVLDVRFHPESKDAETYLIDAPLVINDVAIRIEIASDCFKNLNWVDESQEPSRVIFAAQIEQMSQTEGDPPIAVLTLNGKTAFLWANYENYVALGFRPLDDEHEKQTRMLLTRQIEARQNQK